MIDKYTTSLRQSFSIEYKVRRQDINRESICKTCFSEMVKAIGHYFLEDERDRKYYADTYSCRPPPFFIIIITLIEVNTIIGFESISLIIKLPIDSSLFSHIIRQFSEEWRLRDPFLLTVCLYIDPIKEVRFGGSSSTWSYTPGI